MKRRFSPKEWVTPHTAWRHHPVVTESLSEILKEVYPAPGQKIMVYPAWARLAYDRRWISYETYRKTKFWNGEYHQDMFARMYDSHPFFVLLKKDRLDA